MTKRSVEENEPLSYPERQTIESGLDSASLVTRFATLGILYTGLTPPKLAHLQSRLIRDRPDGKLVVLNETVECRSAGGWAGSIRWQPSDADLIGSSCGINRCDGSFEYDRAPVPIRHDRTAEVLDKFFSIYDVTPSAQTIRKRVEKLGDATGIDRLNTTVLRFTYPVILAEHGFTRDEIAEVIDIADNTQANINFSEEVGPYCRGDNPFICNECDRWTQTGFDLCERHLGKVPVCGAPLDDGSRCQLFVSDPYDQCRHHSDEEQPTCDAETKDGGSCDKIVRQPDDRCRYHTRDS